MSVTDELLQNAERYAAAFDKGELPLPPAKRSPSSPAWTRGSTCTACSASARATRTSSATPAASSPTTRSARWRSRQRLLGTEEIILIHHTDCGMLTFTDDELQAPDPSRTPASSRAWAAEAFADLDAGRPAVDRADQGQPVHPAQGQGPRVRLRRRDRPVDRGLLGHGLPEGAADEDLLRGADVRRRGASPRARSRPRGSRS